MAELKVLVISSSPRKDGNSDLLAKEAMRSAQEAGCVVEYVRVLDMNISPCRACGHCEKKGVCAIPDDFPPLMKKMLDSDVLIFATPIYFMAVSAWGKMVIDRCQTLWARKYALKTPNRAEPEKAWAAVCIAVGGSRSVKMFDSIRLTMKYVYDVLEVSLFEEVFFNQLDYKGAVTEHPEALREAYEKTKNVIIKLMELRRS